jgi:hypothetical protein
LEILYLAGEELALLHLVSFRKTWIRIERIALVGTRMLINEMSFEVIR